MYKENVPRNRDPSAARSCSRHITDTDAVTKQHNIGCFNFTLLHTHFYSCFCEINCHDKSNREVSCVWRNYVDSKHMKFFSSLTLSSDRCTIFARSQYVKHIISQLGVLDSSPIITLFSYSDTSKANTTP